MLNYLAPAFCEVGNYSIVPTNGRAPVRVVRLRRVAFQVGLSALALRVRGGLRSAGREKRCENAALRAIKVWLTA